MKDKWQGLPCLRTATQGKMRERADSQALDYADTNSETREYVLVRKLTVDRIEGEAFDSLSWRCKSWVLVRASPLTDHDSK